MKTNPCPEFPFFGATYPDATCIDGKLFDLDSCTNEEEGLTRGGDYSCPFCRREDFVKEQLENEHSIEEIEKYLEQLNKNYNE